MTGHKGLKIYKFVHYISLIYPFNRNKDFKMYDKIYYPYPATNSRFKYFIITPTGHKVNFGASGYEDFTIHKDPERKQRYIIRHQKRENWDKSGINTAGFWSRWLLWNLPTIKDSYKDIQKRFNI